MLIGLLALAAAVLAFFALPGDRYDPLADPAPRAADEGERLNVAG